MNVECDQKALNELTGAFRFSDAVLRHLVVNMDEAVTEPSPMAKADEEEAAAATARVATAPRAVTMTMAMTARRVATRRSRRRCVRATTPDPSDNG